MLIAISAGKFVLLRIVCVVWPLVSSAHPKRSCPTGSRLFPCAGERYMNVAKLEIVLKDEHVDLAKEMILKTARTGRKGDGLVYVSSVDEAIHIRTGKPSS